MSLGIPWRSRGWDATISPPRLQLQSLAGELRSCKLWSTVKSKQIPLVFGLWAPPDNSEVHLKFLNLISTAKTSLTNKVTARGSRGRLWTCLWGHHSDHPRHLLRVLSALPAPAPWTLCARFLFQPPGMPTPDATPPPNFWDRDPQNKRVQAPSPHLPGCANLDKSLPLGGEGEVSCCLKELC